MKKPRLNRATPQDFQRSQACDEYLVQQLTALLERYTPGTIHECVHSIDSQQWAAIRERGTTAQRKSA